MISLEGLLVGLTALGIIISSSAFGLLSLYKSRKLEAKLLSIAALTMFFVGFLWLGPTVDFFSKLITDQNIDPSVQYVIISYSWTVPALFFALYLGSELLLPEYKWALVGIFLFLGLLFELFLWFSPWQSFGNNIQIQRKDGLIDASFNISHPTFIIFIALLISASAFLIIGFGIKAKQSTGLLRKKFGYLSIGFSIFMICLLLDALTTIPVYVGIIRASMISFALFMYLGLKT